MAETSVMHHTLQERLFSAIRWITALHSGQMGLNGR